MAWTRERARFRYSTVASLLYSDPISLMVLGNSTLKQLTGMEAFAACSFQEANSSSEREASLETPHSM